MEIKVTTFPMSDTGLGIEAASLRSRCCWSRHCRPTNQKR